MAANKDFQVWSDKILFTSTPVFRWPPIPEAECPYAPHRGPEGPNEDVYQCSVCWNGSYSKRPSNETFGYHLADCSLPIDHESYCVGGGAGHPAAEVIRG